MGKSSAFSRLDIAMESELPDSLIKIWKIVNDIVIAFIGEHQMREHARSIRMST
jgi:hypothetical protein